MPQAVIREFFFFDFSCCFSSALVAIKSFSVNGNDDGGVLLEFAVLSKLYTLLLQKLIISFQLLFVISLKLILFLVKEKSTV